ncbi:MAG: PAS domain S-box protein [Chitinophagaceae bacterium]|nr:PAS domain S-box protein [Chitinophagaceae bacterium]
MKNIISNSTRRTVLFLALIDEDGIISCLNATMINHFDLHNPRLVSTNFFDLIHPVHVSEFKRLIQNAEPGVDKSMELYIRNGYYHPMKWQVSALEQANCTKKTYLCLGYKIIDEDRLKKFNELAARHYQLIIEGLTSVIFHDRNGEIIAANRKTADMFGATLERLYEIKNMESLWETQWSIFDEAGERVRFRNTPFMMAMRTGKAQKQTLRIQLKNGEHRWMLFNSQPLPLDEVGSGAFAVSNVIDITTERLLAGQLSEKEAFINSFMKQTPNLAWVVDENARLVFASIAFFTHFGIDEDKSINQKVADLVPPSLFKSLYEKHVAVFETGKPVKFMERLSLADGTNHILHINLFLVDGAEGKKLVGGHSITLADKSKVETELRQANERLLTLNQAVTNAIWEWDMQTGKMYRNETLMEMIGYQPDDSRGLSWWLRRIHPHDRNRVSDKVKEATDSYQHSWQEEYRFKCADGEYKHIQDKGFVIYENGLPVKMIGSLHDISDLKALENKLADEKLARQKEISETVIRVQEMERTRIGHELHDNVNQLLSTTLLFVDMLTPINKDQKQIKGKSVEYVKMAIEEIRKLSRELVVPQLKEEGLADNIQYLIDDIHITDKIKIKFTHDLELDLLSTGKKITLFRIVQEQLKNILKHSQAKNAEIFLQTKHEDVQLIIKDNGIGFDPKQTHRGIGLSNIFERVSFYNGTVDIQTARGKGCIITVTISLV